MMNILDKQDILVEIAVFALAVLWDVALGEPKRLHPVAALGNLISIGERMAPRRGRATPFLFGMALAVLLPGSLALAAYALSKGLRPISIPAYVLIGAYLLKASFAVRELDRAALRVCRDLEGGWLAEARQGLKSLVSRDTANLSPELMASAAVESVAENATDSFVAPWLAFAFFGLPGAIAYRAINTLDSMIGYHGRYEYLGKAAARLDDILNLVPARLAALLIGLAACPRGLVAARRAWQTMWREHGKTESPNAGWTMGAMAGALGVQLQKIGHYKLGEPLHPVSPDDIKAAVKMIRWVAMSAFLLTLGVLVLRYGLFSG